MLREDGKPVRLPFVRWANVFDPEQTEGIQASTIAASQSTVQPHERAAAIVENARLCPIQHAGFAACYSPRDDMIRIPAPSTSQAQWPGDFIVGIEHKELLQECQTSAEGMPLTWAREHGIDTRNPGFAHREQNGDGVSTLMEWKHGTRPTDWLSRPRGHSL
jgi:hypothetical protein